MASGANCKALWGIELTADGAANFGKGGTDINKKFGTAMVMPTREYDPSIIDRYGSGSRGVQGYKRGLFKGGWSAEFDLIHPSIFEAFLGKLTVTGAGPYTYTFEESETFPTLEVDIAEEIAPSTEVFTQLMGLAIKSGEIDIDASANEPIRLKIDGEYAVPKRSNAIPAAFTSAWGLETIKPPTFAQATWKKWNGSAYTPVSNSDKINIRIDQGTELKPSLGSCFPQRARWGERHYDLSAVHLFTDASVYQDHLWGAAISGTATEPGEPSYVGDPTGAHGVQLVITFAGTPAPMYTFEFGKVIVTKASQPVVGPDEEIMESVDMRAGTCSLVVSDWPTAEPVRYH